MARRARKSSTVLLVEALALLLEHLPRHLAEEKLLRAMAARWVRWRYEFDGPHADDDPDPADVLKRLTGEGGPQNFPRVTWAASAIEYNTRHGRCTLYQIQLSRADVEKLLPGPQKRRRKPGPGSERIYDHEVILAAGKTVIGRGVPDLKQTFFDQVRAEVPRGTKLPPEDDNSTLRRIVNHLYDEAKKAKKA